jgi:hypothetical protein
MWFDKPMTTGVYDSKEGHKWIWNSKTGQGAQK